jgi:hypothetical protein
MYNCLKTFCLGECSSYIEQKNEAKRSSGYKMDMTVDTALSDESLEENVVHIYQSYIYPNCRLK